MRWLCLAFLSSFGVSLVEKSAVLIHLPGCFMQERRRYISQELPTDCDCPCVEQAVQGSAAWTCRTTAGITSGSWASWFPTRLQMFGYSHGHVHDFWKDNDHGDEPWPREGIWQSYPHIPSLNRCCKRVQSTICYGFWPSLANSNMHTYDFSATTKVGCVEFCEGTTGRLVVASFV